MDGNDTQMDGTTGAPASEPMEVTEETTEAAPAPEAAEEPMA